MLKPVQSKNELELTLRSGSDFVRIGELDAGNTSLFTYINQTAEINQDPFSGISGENLIPNQEL